MPGYATGEPEYQWGPTQPPGAAPAYGYPQPPGYGYPQAPGTGHPGGAPGWGPQQPGAYPAAYPAGAHPAAPHSPAPYGGAGTPLVSLGDITVLSDSIVTPSGTLPLKGAVWNATDMSRTEEKIPPQAVVLAVVFFLVCFLGLLFLLWKEKTTTGFIQVTVTSGGRHHSTMIPATGPNTFAMVMGQLNYARSLSA
ncbi:hypothetical protein NX801_18850 [Streptomyces sp. LP05-1]|uniref:Uncharacterized protein n=1 Tax=Streptomyces pyxinae TaxID=2970734 RepID=A0ABT2CJU0_9ACTN|nr:hypothetical protein [Streptomyces sp. LP05-1]MCS0637685.1 hypothetical protein [Streptomyces sp. LP05-1]